MRTTKGRINSIVTNTGGELQLHFDRSANEYYLQWSTGAGYLFGVQENTLELRNFLRRTLKRLETAAVRQACDRRAKTHPKRPTFGGVPVYTRS